MKLFYGNIDFVKVFKDAGIEVTEIDFGKKIQVPEGSSEAKVTLSNIAHEKGVIIIKNFQQIKLGYEKQISRYLTRSQNEPFVMLGDLRFDYFREVKLAMSGVIKKLSGVSNTERIIISSGIEEVESMSLFPVQPTIMKDISSYMEMVEEVVPFVEDEEKKIRVLRARSFHKGISHETMDEYLEYYKGLLAGERITTTPEDQKPQTGGLTTQELPTVRRGEISDLMGSEDDEKDDLPF